MEPRLCLLFRKCWCRILVGISPALWFSSLLEQANSGIHPQAWSLSLPFHDISNSSVSCNALVLECVADGSCRYEAVITYPCFGRHCSTADCTVFLWGYVIHTDRSVKSWISRFTQLDLAKVHWYVLHDVGLVKTTCGFVTWSPLHCLSYVTHSPPIPVEFACHAELLVQTGSF